MIPSSEHDEQTLVISWARTFQHLHPSLRWLFAIPNGARLKGKKEAWKLKEEGLTPGIADLFLPYPARNFAGFFIEMKRPGNFTGTSETQKEFIAYCEKAGFLAQVHDNGDDAIEALKWYLGISD